MPYEVCPGHVLHAMSVTNRASSFPELRKVDVDVVTFGQYMRPTKRHMKVDRYVEPAEFDRWKQVAEDMGFLYVASGPLVRSSYKVSMSHLWAATILITSVGWRVLHRERLEGQGYREAHEESCGRQVSGGGVPASVTLIDFPLHSTTYCTYNFQAV